MGYNTLVNYNIHYMKHISLVVYTDELIQWTLNWFLCFQKPFFNLSIKFSNPIKRIQTMKIKCKQPIKWQMIYLNKKGQF